MLYVVYYQINIFFYPEKVEVFGMLFIFMCHTGTAYQLQLMHFESCNRKTRQRSGLCNQILMRFTGKSQYNMPTGKNTAGNSPFHSIYRILKSVSAIDSAECGIVSAFNTIFNQQKSVFIHFFQIMQQSIRHAIRPGTDDQTDHIGNRQCFLIFPLQCFQFTVSIGVCLKIGKVFHFRALHFSAFAARCGKRPSGSSRPARAWRCPAGTDSLCRRLGHR